MLETPLDVRVDLELFLKKSKQHLADAARKAALGASADANGNQKQLKLELGDPLSYWIIQVWTFLLYVCQIIISCLLSICEFLCAWFCY